jgi:YVTN family beta-propeller protein
VPAAELNTGRLAFFLNLKQSEVPHLKLQVTAVEIFNGELWLPLSFATKDIDTKKIGRRQVSLGHVALAPGNYESVRMTFSSVASIVSQDKETSLSLGNLSAVIPFAVPLKLQNETSEAIFLAWDVEAPTNGGNLGPLAISATTSHLSPITANHVYVACPDLNTIYVVREDKKWVDNSFFVAGRPTYLFVDGIMQRIFVLCQEDGDIKVFDLLNNSLVDIISLPMTFRPIFMSPSTDLTKAYVVDDLGSLSAIDLRSGRVSARTRIGQRPTYVIHLDESKTVALSSSKDNRVYLLDDETLETKDIITVDGSPAGIFQKDGFIYIAEEQANSITVYDYNLRSTVRSMFVGSAPRRLTALADKIYVANSDSGSVSLLTTRNSRVVREIVVGYKVYEMAASEKDKVVYIGKNDKEDCGGSVSIVDLTSNNVIGEIEIGARPWGIAVAGNGR